jgi:UDP-glucuronate decarboxylase
MKDERRKRVLVAGGAGFLGSHLCERLLREGREVLCVDNFFTGSRDNIVHLLSHPHFELLRHDICFPIHVEVNEIYNFACPASPLHYQLDPIQTIKTSVLGALNLLGLAKRLKCKIFQASTSEVYGDPHIHPQKEEYWGNVNPIGIRSCYDEGKRCAETLFFDYNRIHGVPIKIGRIFNTYGPRMHPNDGRVVSNLIVQALTGQPLTIYGDGTQTRSFCYVDDLIEVIFRLMNSPQSITGPINIGNPVEFRMLDLANEVLRLTETNSPFVFHPLPADDPRQRRPDISKAREFLGWEPKISLESGLQETIKYFRERIPGPCSEFRLSERPLCPQ